MRNGPRDKHALFTYNFIREMHSIRGERLIAPSFPGNGEIMYRFGENVQHEEILGWNCRKWTEARVVNVEFALV